MALIMNGIIILIIYLIIICLNYIGLVYIIKKDFGKVSNGDKFYFITISPFIPIISFLLLLGFHINYKLKNKLK